MKINSFIFKSFMATMFVLLLIFSIIFFVMASFLSEYSLKTQKNEINLACEILVETILENPKYDLVSATDSMYAMSAALNTRFFIADSVGRTTFCTDAQPCTHKDAILNNDIIEKIATDGMYSEIGYLNYVYNIKYYTCIKPIYVDGNNNNIIIGYVCASKRSDEIYAAVSQLTGLFIIVALLSLVITLILIYFLVYGLTRPIKRLTVAASAIAKGDLTSRVQMITGNDEISQLSKTFNEMAESIESSDKVREQFVANVSHELKTPMTTIGGFVDGILDGTIPAEKHNQYLSIVSSETKRLSRLIKTLLYLSKIESGEEKPMFEYFNYADVLTKVIVSLEPQMAKKKLNIEGLDWNILLMTQADKDMIFQVTYNLVENAIKYSPQGGNVTFIFNTQNGHHFITIRNEGGISHDDLKHIFERFYKVDKSRGLDSQSTGIGLYLVVTLLRINGQTITAHSDETSFTEFTFTLSNI